MSDIGGSSISVQQELAYAGTQINQKAQAIADDLNNLQVTWLAPLGETWAGNASGLYQDYQAEWNAAADGLFGPDGVLGAIAQAMNVTWNNYSEAEWANIKTWQPQ